MIFPRNACFLCAMCCNVTELFSFALKYTVQNPLLKRQLCPKFINATIEDNLLHTSGAKITLCNVAMKGFPLSSHIFIHTWPLCFAVMWCSSVTSMYLSISSYEPGMKSETSGVIWHVATKSKSNWSIAIVTILFTLTFVIARHSCHRCVYLLVIIIFGVVAGTITFFIKTYLILPFFTIFWWLGTFCEHVISRSTAKAFPRCTLRLSIV